MLERGFAVLDGYGRHKSVYIGHGRSLRLINGDGAGGGCRVAALLWHDDWDTRESTSRSRGYFTSVVLAPSKAHCRRARVG
jgi:hypothetical protein